MLVRLSSTACFQWFHFEESVYYYRLLRLSIVSWNSKELFRGLEVRAFFSFLPFGPLIPERFDDDTVQRPALIVCGSNHQLVSMLVNQARSVVTTFGGRDDAD